MTIGVITFCFSKDNYGQILQCYALQQHLIKNGYDPFLIRYQPILKQEKPKFKIRNIIKYILRLKTYFKWWVNTTKELSDKKRYNNNPTNINRGFDDFITNNISATPLYDRVTIHKNPPAADLYICGSDQIWGGAEDSFFLSFVPDGKKRIAYAPSMGGLTLIPDSAKSMMLSELSKFSFIGMRENSGKLTLSKLGIKDVTTVIDPTMLLTSKDYSKITRIPNTKKEYVFVYLLGKPSECKISEITDFVNCQGLEIIYVASGGQNDKHPKTNASIEEWIGYISKAKFVITNSFHCTVFALLHKVPFATILLTNGYERMNCRVEELLDQSALTNRIYRGSLEDIYNSDIDFSQFDSYRERFADKSSNLLNSAINQ